MEIQRERVLGQLARTWGSDLPLLGHDLRGAHVGSFISNSASSLIGVCPAGTLFFHSKIGSCALLQEAFLTVLPMGPLFLGRPMALRGME